MLREGRIVSTTRREVTTGSLAVTDGRIAGIHEDPDQVIGPDTRVIDLEDRIVAPGLVDAHTHLDLHQAVESAYPRILEAGTTSVVSEVAAFGPAFGAEGLDALLEATAELPLRVFATVPPQRFFDLFEAPRGSDRDREALEGALERDRVVGVGETAWVRLVGRESGAAPLYERATRLGKTVSGHGAGVSGSRLQAFGTIVTDDHEAISAEGVRERVGSGIHTIGRYGSIRDDMDAFIDAADDIDASELSLSTDGMWPRELVSEGHMDAVLRRAIDGGIDPIDAIVMATRTPSRHFGLDGLGSLTPGSPADIVVLSDLEEPEVELTIVDGSVVVEQPGSVALDPIQFSYPERMTSLPVTEFSPDDFTVDAASTRGASVRAIEYDGGLLSEETTVSPARDDGELHADPVSDVLKLALYDRSPDGDRGGFTGFVTGFGLERGAIATTVTWETPGLLVLGTAKSEMAAAANRVISMDGGWSVVEDGTVVADLPTPIGATCAAKTPGETAKAYDAVESAVGDLGGTVERPLLGLQTITFFGVPSLKMAFDGYAAIRQGEIVGLDPE